MTDILAQNGIEVADGAQATVTNNAVSGNWYRPCGDYLTCYNAAGILLYSTSHAVVGTNTLTANQAGVNLFLAPFADIAGNHITGSAWAIIVDTSNDVNVRGNTIGVPTVGPNALQVIGVWALNSLRVAVTGNVINFGGAVDPVSTLYGISFEDSSGRIVSNEVLNVRMAAAFFGLQTGVGIVATGIGTLSIEDNTVSNYQKGGIVVGRFGNGLGNDPVNAVILRNRVTGVGPTALIAQNGIQVADTAYAVIDSNAVSGNTYTGGFWTSVGILLYLARSGTQVTGNSLFGNQAGIYVFRTANVLVTTNDIHGGALGIVVDTSDGATVSRNLVDTPTVVPNEPEVIGIWAIDSLGLTVSENVLDFGGAVGVVPTLRGINLESASGSILGNTVFGVRMAGADFSRLTGIGIVATGTGNLRIADNTVRNYQWGGIFIGLPGSPYTGRVDIVNNLVRGVGPTRLIRQIGVLLVGPGVTGSVRGNFIADNCFTGGRNGNGHDDDNENGEHDHEGRDQDANDNHGNGRCRGESDVSNRDRRTCPPGVAVGLLLCNVGRDAMDIARNRFSGNQVNFLRIRT
jgi:parallel beta-helix repeat protein